MNTDTTIKQVEQDALQALTDQLRTGKITEEHARRIAAFVLQSLKQNMTIGELWNVAKNFEYHFPELTKAALDVNEEYSKQLRQIVLQEVDKLIAQGRIAEANSLLEATIKREHDMAVKTFPHEPNNPQEASGDADPEKVLTDFVNES